MKALTTADIVRIWELGIEQNSLDRAITILSLALPQITQEEIARLSLGQLNARLFQVRERLFGAKMNCYIKCPSCSEDLEFTIMAPALNGRNTIEYDQPEFQFSVEGFQLRFRLLNSLDLKTVAGASSRETMRRWLVERSLIESIREGRRITADQLPETVIVSLAELLSEYDPEAEILLNLECPACKNHWQAIFDIASFFWKELSIQAHKLLGEVHTLASAYGWGESEILALSARRRHFYLELISA